MRSIGGIVAVALLLFACPRLAAADDVEIEASYFKYGGTKYFRRDAPVVKLGSYGQKKTPLLAINYLAVEDTIATEKLAAHAEVSKSGPVIIDWKKYSKTDVSANFGFKYFTMGAKTALTGDYETFKSAKLKLVMFSIAEGPMKKAINGSDAVLNYLKKEGSDGRVVTRVWVVVDAKLATHLENSTTVTLSGKAGGAIEITAKLSASSSTSESHTIILPKGMVFAYLLSKVKDWNKGKTEVLNLAEDPQGAS